MDDFWEMYVFRLNTGSHYLIPVCSGGEETAWQRMADKLSRGIERTKRDCKLIHTINGAYFGRSKIVKL